MDVKKNLGLAWCLMLTLFFVANSAVAVTVDGTISAGEWDGSIYEDALGDNASSSELASWGAKIEGGYLYWFCELGAGQTYDGTFYGIDQGGAFPSLLLNVDSSDATYIAYGEASNMVDSSLMNSGHDASTEWAVNHRGVDIALQVQHTGNWTSGNDYAYGYGGIGGTADNSFYVEYDLIGENPEDADDLELHPEYGEWSTSSTVMEASISVARLEALVASLGFTTLGDYITLGVGLEGSDRDLNTVAWGVDVDTPKVLATDPVNKPLLSGDANLDGKVDGSDVTILANNWQNGVSGVDETVVWQAGDFNGDGKIDGSDVTILANSWQDGVAGMTASVPEPGVWMLLWSALGAFLFWRKKR